LPDPQWGDYSALQAFNWIKDGVRERDKEVDKGDRGGKEGMEEITIQ